MSFFNSIGRSMGRSGRTKSGARSTGIAGVGGADNVPPLPTSQSFSGAGGVVGQPADKPLYLCNPFVRSALIKGSFKTIVVLPKYVDQREWVAVNRECRRTPCQRGWMRIRAGRRVVLTCARDSL